MGLASKIWGATIGKIADGAGKISGDITKVKLAKSGDKTQVEANASLEQMQVLKQYASEFTGKQGIVEKFNKLVRPLFAITAWVVFGVRYLTPMIIFLTKDLTLNDLMEIYNILWVSDKWIIGGIISFYFGGRMQTKSHDNKNNNLLNKKIAGILASKAKRRKSGDDLHSMEGVNSKPEDAKLEIEYDPLCSGRFSKLATQDMVYDLGEKLGADRIVVTGADRSREVHLLLVKTKQTTASYDDTQHGIVQGFKAADVKYYKNGKQIQALEVAKVAMSLKQIGGVGVYKTFTHIDWRTRKEDGSIYKWGW